MAYKTGAFEIPMHLTVSRLWNVSITTPTNLQTLAMVLSVKVTNVFALQQIRTFGHRAP
jgi:hypothetical protein